MYVTFFGAFRLLPTLSHYSLFIFQPRSAISVGTGQPENSALASASASASRLPHPLSAFNQVVEQFDTGLYEAWQVYGFNWILDHLRRLRPTYLTFLLTPGPFTIVTEPGEAKSSFCMFALHKKKDKGL